MSTAGFIPIRLILPLLDAYREAGTINEAVLGQGRPPEDHLPF
jgi:hypothetical protein